MASKMTTEKKMALNKLEKEEDSGNPARPHSPTADSELPEIETRRKSCTPKRVIFSPDAPSIPTADPMEIKPMFFRQDTPHAKLGMSPSRLAAMFQSDYGNELIVPVKTDGRKSSSPNLGLHRPMKSPAISPIHSDDESPSFEEFKNIFNAGKAEEKLNRFIDDDEFDQMAKENESLLSFYDDSHSFLNKNVSLSD